MLNDRPRPRRPWLRAALIPFAAAALLPVGLGAQTDQSPPTITLFLDGELGRNGWHLGDTTVGWSYSDEQSGIRRTEGCDTNTVEAETTGTEFTCRVTNGAGLTVSSSYTVKLDKLPPRVRPRGARAPDANGWFNHPVRFLPGATDTASGIAWCNRIPSYAGPDRRRIRFVVRCRDRAGRRASGLLTFKYDETPPRKVRAVRKRPPDRYGWYSRNLRIRFVGKDALSGLAGCSSPVYRGPSTPRARVRGGCRDRAGNVTSKTVRFRFAKPLLVPAAGTRTGSPPLLDWVDVRRARGYNVQLWRDGRKLLSRWPDESRIRLGTTWKYGGRERRLRRGERYVWYVWPLLPSGYGDLLGRSTFTLARRGSGLVAAVGLEPTTHGL